MTRFVVAAALIALLTTGAIAQVSGQAPWHDPSRCSQQDVMKADEAVDHLKNWTAMYRVFRQYGKCDDGGIAEGFSDAVVKLLALHWPSVGELSNLVRKDPLFLQFVTMHIDQTVDGDQEKMIVAHARDHCPSGLDALCRRLEKAAANP